MNFIQTGFLIGSAAVAIPLIIHLLNRWQVRRVELGTMRFLNEVIRDGAQRRRIRRWLLLLTRMALVALLACLFARPFLPGRSQRDGDHLQIVLIDRSASMGMPGNSGRVIDDALTAAADGVAEYGEGATVLWAWFDGQVEPLPASTTRPTVPRALDGDTNYQAAVEWARDRIGAFPESLAEVMIVTDLQQSGLAMAPSASESLGFPDNVPVRIVDVGRAAANNLAITQFAPLQTRLDTKTASRFGATLFNFGNLPQEEVPMVVSASNGTRQVRLKKSISVPSGQAEDVQFDLGNLDAGLWRVTASIDVADDLAADNRRLTAVQVAQPLNLLVIDGGAAEDGSNAASYYLAAALGRQSSPPPSIEGDAARESAPPSRFAVEVLFLEDQSMSSLDGHQYPLVVVSDAGALSAQLIANLESYVSGGGRLLVFAGDAVDTATLDAWNQSKLVPGTLRLPQPSGVTPFRIKTLATRTEMLSPFADPQHGDLTRLAFRKLLPVSVADQTKVLARFDGDRPAMTRQPVGQGSVVWFLSSADSSWSNWTTNPLYLPLVQQMAGDLLNLTGEGPIRFRRIGEPLDFERPSRLVVTQAALNPASPPIAEPVFEHAGFEQQPHALYVINGSSRESDPTRMEASALANHFGLNLADATNRPQSQSVATRKPNELWPWLAAAACVLLIGEFALANRTVS